MSEQAAAYLAGILRPLIGAVRAAAPRVIATGNDGGNDGGELDAEAVHDLRVAIRRLRTLLLPARRAFGKKKLRPIEDGLREHARASSALRDEEALRETLAALELDPGARAAVDAWLADRALAERSERATVIRRLEGRSGQKQKRTPSLEASLARLERRLDRPKRKPREALAVARRAISDALADMQRLAGVDPTDVEGMHTLRIRFKRLRYTAEAFTPLLGEGAARVVALATRMQKRLGNLHDVDDALAHTRRARKLDPAARDALIQALGAARTRLAARAEAELARELPAIITACGAASRAPLGGQPEP